MTLARCGSFVIFVPSWWRIADPRLVAADPVGFSRTSKVSLVTPAILHHEGTKITREQVCCGASVAWFSELTETVSSQQMTQ